MDLLLSSEDNVYFDEWVYDQIHQKVFYVNKELKSLLKTKWNLYVMTPISKFNLNSFKKSLNQQIKNKIIEDSFDCNVDFVNGLSVSPKDSTAIKIDIHSKETTIQIILISRESEIETKTNFYDLPVLLYNGSKQHCVKVIKVLEDLFENSISPYNLSLIEKVMFSLVVGLNCGHIDPAEESSILLRYAPADNKMGIIEYNIDLGNLVKCWKKICQDGDLVGISEKINLLYKELLKHFRRSYSIDLSSFILVSVSIKRKSELSSIVTPVTSKVAGKCTTIKTQIPELMDLLIRYLTKYKNLENKV